MSLIRKHVAVLQAWACLDLVTSATRALAVVNVMRYINVRFTYTYLLTSLREVYTLYRLA